MATWHVGAHIPRKKTLMDTIQEIERVGGNALQIFASNPRSGRYSETSWQRFVENEDAICSYNKTKNIEIWIHSSYAINLAAPFPGGDPKKAWWIQSLLTELALGHRIGAKGVVVHVGKWVSAGNSLDGRKQMEAAVRYILAEMPAEYKIRLVLETPAGQGTELLEHAVDFGAFVKLFPKEKLGVCIDTAHVWAVGYSVDVKTLSLFVRACGGIKRIALLHINNSQKERGSHVDRHERLEAKEGHIPYQQLSEWIRWSKSKNVSVILETPEHGYVKEIPMLTGANKM